MIATDDPIKAILTALIGCGLLGGSIYYFAIAWRETRMTIKLERHGVTAPGKITNWNVPMGQRTKDLRKVAFTYNMNGITYRGNQILWKNQVQFMLKSEQKIEIRYLAGNPHSARLDALFRKTPMVLLYRLKALVLLIFACPLLSIIPIFFHWLPKNFGALLAAMIGCSYLLICLASQPLLFYLRPRKKHSS